MKRFYYLLILLSTVLIIFLSFLSLGENIIQTNAYESTKLEITNKIDECIKNNSNNYKNNVNNKTNYLKIYPQLLECNLNYTHKWTPLLTIDQYDSKSIDYTKVVSESSYEYRINRAIIIYYPVDATNVYESEFKWFYQSWLEMQKYESNKWRTDLIFFIDKNNADESLLKFFESYNCTFNNKRMNRIDKPICRLIDYIALKDRLLDKGLNKFNSEGISVDELSTNLYEYLYQKINIFGTNPDEFREFYVHLKEKLSKYNYLDSILVAFEGYQEFKNIYDHLIRSDMDVFLTPLFAKWLPYNCNDFYVGRGGYSDTFNMKRLKRVAFNLNLKYANIANLGSTWYSTPEQFRLVSYLTLVSMMYLSNEEFSPPEKEFNQPILWPYWHYGVLLLYGQNIAMNHLIYTKQLNIIKLSDLIDVPTDSEISIYKAIHLHVFHGRYLFSKFSFKKGEYDNYKIYDENDDTTNHNLNFANYYALNIALKSKFYNSSTVLKQFNEINEKYI